MGLSENYLCQSATVVISQSCDLIDLTPEYLVAYVRSLQTLGPR